MTAALNSTFVYNIPNIIYLLKAIHYLSDKGLMNIEALMRHEQVGTNRERKNSDVSLKSLCVRKTLDRYVNKSVLVDDFENNDQMKLFKNVMDAIPEHSFYLIVEYVERVDPNILK